MYVCVYVIFRLSQKYFHFLLTFTSKHIFCTDLKSIYKYTMMMIIISLLSFYSFESFFTPALVLIVFTGV